jgi:muramidase (phage lysozyme)
MSFPEAETPTILIKKTLPRRQKNIQFVVGLLMGMLLIITFHQVWKIRFYPHLPMELPGTQPLVMEGGDPYIRALMRTISASEANDSKPYNLLYGGTYVFNLSHHPNRCITIVTGPNLGNCSTAAGRYQFINTTWAEKAQKYHPKLAKILWWKSYSFEPEYQDLVVSAWLSDSQAWGVDIPQLLRQGKINEVLRLLSGTWTSLGYGIETNSMSYNLPTIYQKILQEELKNNVSL